MKVADRCFKSFFALVRKAKSGSYQFNMVQLPHYLSKEGWFSLIIPRIKIKDGAFVLPMSRDFKREHGELRFTIPPQISDKEIADKFLGVDLGLDNLASCVTNEGASFIIDGKQIKSYNRLYNKWKQSINLGDITNQNFVQIPHGKLREKLKYLCELYGINYFEQEESYTSKASFFDNDALPVYNADNPQSYTFSGRRITRGQYRTSSGYVLNADINGALNILRKSKLVNLSVLLQARKGQNRGCVLRSYGKSAPAIIYATHKGILER